AVASARYFQIDVPDRDRFAEALGDARQFDAASRGGTLICGVHSGSFAEDAFATGRDLRHWMMAIDPSASAMAMNDTSVVTVPSAYSAGEVTLVVIPQISIGSVFAA